jgi:hypothetical protein
MISGADWNRRLKIDFSVSIIIGQSHLRALRHRGRLIILDLDRLMTSLSPSFPIMKVLEGCS